MRYFFSLWLAIPSCDVIVLGFNKIVFNRLGLADTRGAVHCRSTCRMRPGVSSSMAARRAVKSSLDDGGRRLQSAALPAGWPGCGGATHVPTVNNVTLTHGEIMSLSSVPDSWSVTSGPRGARPVLPLGLSKTCVCPGDLTNLSGLIHKAAGRGKKDLQGLVCKLEQNNRRVPP